jgi:flagellar FliJ protein
MTAKRDPLGAVARVRRVREQDSLLGLHQARREAEAAHAHVASLDAGLDRAQDAAPLDVAAYAAHRQTMVTVARAATQARVEAEAADGIAEVAHAHWAAARVRLEAIEMLRERAAERRRAELAAHEARELDEIAGRLWTRNREAS